MIEKTNHPLDREDWADYVDQKTVMYCPPAQYSPEIESQIVKFSHFASVSARFLCSPQYTKPTKKTIKGLNLRGYALDNGAYLCHTKQQAFDHDAFLLYLDQYVAFADWVVLPDVVCDSKKTLDLADVYIDKILNRYGSCKMLIVWQDGMKRSDLLPFVRSGIGVFVGGSTEGKMQNLKWIGDLCNSFGVWSHVGRVNSIKRLDAVLGCGINSFDGSGLVRFLPTLALLCNHLIKERSHTSLFCEYRPTIKLLNGWLKKKRCL